MSWTKTKINEQLLMQHQEFNDVIDAASGEVFKGSESDSWSVGQIQNHILLSVKPIIIAMSLPKFLLRFQFGLTNRPSRSYEELVARYLKALDGKNAVAPKQFIPKRINSKNRHKQTLKLNKSVQKLISISNRWKESDLDLYVVPHPLIGKLTLREILYFTCYHVQHHKNQIDAILTGENNQ